MRALLRVTRVGHSCPLSGGSGFRGTVFSGHGYWWTVPPECQSCEMGAAGAQYQWTDRPVPALKACLLSPGALPASVALWNTGCPTLAPTPCIAYTACTQYCTALLHRLQRPLHRTEPKADVAAAHKQPTYDPASFALVRLAILLWSISAAAPSSMVDALQVAGNLQGRALWAGLVGALVLAQKLQPAH